MKLKWFVGDTSKNACVCTVADVYSNLKWHNSYKLYFEILKIFIFLSLTSRDGCQMGTGRMHNCIGWDWKLLASNWMWISWWNSWGHMCKRLRNMLCIYGKLWWSCERKRNIFRESKPSRYDRWICLMFKTDNNSRTMRIKFCLLNFKTINVNNSIARFFNSITRDDAGWCIINYHSIFFKLELNRWNRQLSVDNFEASPRDLSDKTRFRAICNSRCVSYVYKVYTWFQQ